MFKKKKLLDDKFRNFLPNFSKLLNFVQIFLYFWKAFKTDYKRLNFVGQSSKTEGEFKNESDSDFLKIGELWSTYFDVFDKPFKRATTSYQIFLGQSSKTKSYCVIKF